MNSSCRAHGRVADVALPCSARMPLEARGQLKLNCSLLEHGCGCRQSAMKAVARVAAKPGTQLAHSLANTTMLTTVASVLRKESNEDVELAVSVLSTVLASPEARSSFLTHLHGARILKRLLATSPRLLSESGTTAVLKCIPLIGTCSSLSSLGHAMLARVAA